MKFLSEKTISAVGIEEFQKKSSAYPVYMFPPTEGTILLFPASIMHKVESNQSDEDRISVAFNLTFRI